MTILDPALEVPAPELDDDDTVVHIGCARSIPTGMTFCGAFCLTAVEEEYGPEHVCSMCADELLSSATNECPFDKKPCSCYDDE